MAILQQLSPIEQCESMSAPLPTGGVTKGEVLTIGTKLVYAFAEVTEQTISGGHFLEESGINTGPTFTAVTKAPAVRATKQTSLAIAQGAAVYWDATNDRVTTATTGNTACGFCRVAAASAATEVEISWEG